MKLGLLLAPQGSTGGLITGECVPKEARKKESTFLCLTVVGFRGKNSVRVWLSGLEQSQSSSLWGCLEKMADESYRWMWGWMYRT